MASSDASTAISTEQVDPAQWREWHRRHIAGTHPGPVRFLVERASGCFIYGRDEGDAPLDAGQGGSPAAYLDFLSGIGVANVGHRHPRVVQAVRDQIERHMHVMVYGEYVQAAQVRLARAIAAAAPAGLTMTYFTNSGAEAVEGALKLGRKKTGRPGIVAFEGAYHGDTYGCLSLRSDAAHRRPFVPVVPGVRYLPFGDRSALAQIDGSVGAVIIEPIQAEAGVREPPPGFLTALRERCDAVEALLIFDEVQVGLGRTGKWFAGEHWGAVPDVMTLAKALGGGMPIGGFVGRPELLGVLAADPPLGHLTTFGGHPVSAAAGAAALALMADERLPERAATLGERLGDRLRRLESADGPVVGVRGRGLLWGLALRSTAAARALIRAAWEHRLIIGDCLGAPSVVKLAPPLVITEELLDAGIAVLEECLVSL